ncbi:PHD finger protein 3 [Buceros rhinoceros silvestris]|uniref:PHD finger protein 3 n=1 Tax=Buceros rhinoceros silvestris TaxID=175836 RepID=A0A091HRV5_BUCRH|nr:PREDICTED: PHD finger protein 3 [Buceros rhinoceros silvestris]KFO90013.1 PHD finger protein 3 [Buceros rhinoceros silvestris]
MDIVDTFNHLIPTEHLDDALFLESNLENEVCEDFSASQNVLEDSLKNMLSDKDPMLGSASAQFCLPVLDSNDPNFQMPCSTVIGLDDIMDEEGVKESGNDTIDDDELVLPNRNLRSRCEETLLASPRKSPRLMAQEQVRSLRQSTLAKRSNVASSVNSKKSSVKSGSSPKTGQKQERSPAKETDVAAPLKTEQPKEVRRSARRLGQTEGTGAAVTASQSNTKCLSGPEEVNEIKSETLEQEKVEETSQQLSCADLAGASSPPSGETKEVTEVATKTESGNVESVCSVSADAEITAVKKEPNYVIDSMGSETSAEEKTENKTEELEKKTEAHDQSGVTGKANDLSSACVNQSEISETSSILSSSVEDGVDGSLCSHGVEVHDENTLSVKKCVTEPVDDDKEVGKTVTASEKLLDSTEIGNKDLKSKEFTSADPGNSILESTVLDQTSQTLQQQISSIKVEGPVPSKLQDDDKQISISTKCEKNIRPRHSKSVIQNKQNLIAGTRQKPGTLQQEVTRSRTRAGLAISGLHSPSGLKRNADEQESHQHPNNPVKIRKKESDLSLKSKSCISGATVKKQSNTMLKKIPRVQPSGQVQKSSNQRASEKSPTRQSCSKDTHYSVHSSGHASHPSQKQALGQKHQLAAVLKANSSMKEEAETKDPPVIEHLKEDDKERNKSKRIDKNLQPRQRRSSKSLSLDEPPLFIPDNISTVKREGLEHTSASESKHVWVPNKQCGFCKKPHGNRFMVGCGRCDDWFHGDCVGLSLSQAQQMGEEDKEYVCMKCCAEEDKKMECLDQSVTDAQVKLEIHREEKVIECDKQGIVKQMPTCNLSVTTEKTKQTEDAGKHKVKIFRRESGDGKNLSESRDSDTKKGQQVLARKGSQTAVIPRRSPEDKNEKISKESLSVVEKSTKSGVHEKQELKKKKNEKGSISAAHLPAVPASKPSADQIRQSVKQSLKEILMKRLTDSSLKIPEERAAKVATRIEKELFSFFRDTDSKYKNKYRSLMFNLKDPKNNILFKKVLKGEVTPDHLIKMSPEELASKELAAWRQRENRHTIEMIEKEQREVERRPITKITHKGEIEIESETPIKEQEEVMEIQEPNTKVFEKSEEAEKDKEVTESASPDTTSQHKNHLFDLNCKICIGRMAPPTDDLSAKKVKVSVGVARKQSDNEAESIADALSSTSSILASELLEDDKQDSSKSSFTPLPKSETPGTVECESLFLARLNFIWKGFINMPSVAKFVIKAYPVSGSFEYLTEDLPDSIQVGGRISPHTVWEYVEKIKASGTKEICVVRFTPVTEEDQISYALLFAYFSSRKRYGVAANNMKQVKDLYLIPLGSSDKVPHHLVPFDGPGIEIHRPNLLLGLIIRQKMKRQITSVAGSSFADEASESTLSNLPPEKKSKPNKPEVSHHELALEEEEENDFFNSFTTVLHKQRNKPQQSNIEDVPPVTEPSVESTKHEPPKPLRFLPGVLVGWENQPSTLELANKPLPVDDILQSLLGTTGQVYEHSKSEASPSEDKPVLTEQATLNEENTDAPEVTTEISEAKTGLDDVQESTNAPITVDAAGVGTSSSARSTGSLIGLSLKGKPPDVSTEAFLANLSAQSQNKETEESKESDPKRQLPDKDNVAQEVRKTTNSSFSSSSSNAGKKPNENNVNVGSAEGTTANTSKSPPFINLKRDPRQAAGRSQQTNASENKEGDVSRNEDRQNVSGNDQMEPENKQSSGEVGLNPCQSDAQTNEMQYGSTGAKADNAVASQAEDPKRSQEDTLMQNIETVNSFRRGPAATSSHFETETSSRSEFISKVPNPITSGSFASVRPPQQNFQHPKSNPPGFQFQAPAPLNFPPQSNPMFGFPPHLPPPLLPPPGFGFPQNPMMPWPPVTHLSGQPPHYAGPIAQGLPVAHKQPRFLGPENFFQNKDSRRPERRHSDPWGRQEQHLERGFNRGKNDQHRQRFYSESHHQKKDRHEKEWNNEKYWEQDSERNRRRDRNQEKERERKSREEGQRDKERVRSPHSDRAADGKSPSSTRNPEKKTEKPKSEEQAHEKDKEREKSKEKHRERESEKNKERHRDHSDRTKSKR